MPPEIALLESRALRESVSTRTEVLDRVKALVLLPDSLHITTRMVADYFEVTDKAIYSLIQRHREELESSGLRVLRGETAGQFRTFNLKVSGVSGQPITVYPRRAVLNVAMLLRDSAVAREVRTYLLDTESASLRREPVTPPPPSWGMPPGRRLGPGPHWDEYEYLQAHPNAPVPEQYTAPDHWVQSVDRRLDAHGCVIGAMSDQLHRVGDDVRELRKDIAQLNRHGRR